MTKKKRAGAHLGCSSRRLSRRLPIEDSTPWKGPPGPRGSVAALAVELRHPRLRVTLAGRDAVRERIVKQGERGRVEGIVKDAQGVGEPLARARPDQCDDVLRAREDPRDRELPDG